MITFYATASDGRAARSTDTPMQFPAGEQHIVDASTDGECPRFVCVRGADADEFVSAAMWIDLAHRKGHRVSAVVPYLPGARQDRGQPHGAQVYADLINMMHADRVVTFDPHSPIMPSLIENLVVVDSAAAVADATSAGDGFSGVICPDEGARNRSQTVADALNLPLYQAGKRRDFATGKLSGFSCEPLPPGGRFLVVDDICDGGGTFLGLADATGLSAERLALWVSHGVFSGKAHQLRNAFGEIYTTDSHPGHARADVGARIIPVLPYLTTEIL